MRLPEEMCGYCEQAIDDNDCAVDKGRFIVHEGCDVAYFMNGLCVDTKYSQWMAQNACGAV